MFIKTLESLNELYGEPAPASLTKVAQHLTPRYKQWITASRFVIVSTVGDAGTDASPRGDVDPVVRIINDTTLWLPDWKGNNRLDSMRNIVTDGRISLMFMIPGNNNVVRINGSALLTADKEVISQFEQKGNNPKTVIIISVNEIYFQCAKALMRSELWSGTLQNVTVPTAGEFLKEAQQGFDAVIYDKNYEENAQAKLW